MMESQQLGHHIEFATVPPDYLRCMICQLVLKDPVQIMTCGHHYCENCFQRIKGYAIVSNTELRCPVDQSVVDVNKVFRDLSITRVISSLHVKCPFGERGCAWLGELGDLEVHKNKCKYSLNKNSGGNTDSYSESSDVGFPSVELLEGLIERLGQCESSLASSDKELAHIRFQLKETKKLMSRKDEEIEILKQRILKCEETNSSNGDEIERLRAQKTGHGNIETIQSELELLNQKIAECKQEYAADTISYQICINEIEKLKINKIGEHEITKITKDIHGLKTEVKAFRTKLSTNEIDSHDDVMFIPNVRHKKSKPLERKPETDSTPDISVKRNTDTSRAKQKPTEVPKKRRGRTGKTHTENTPPQEKKLPDTSKSKTAGAKCSKPERLVKFDVIEVNSDGKRSVEKKLAVNKLKMGGGASWSCPVLNRIDLNEMGPAWTCAACQFSNRADDVECSACGAWVL